MDSQENALNQGTEEVKLSEETVAKAPTEQNEATAEGLNQSTETQSKCEAETYSAKTYSTKKEIIERLKAIVDSDDTPEKAEVDHLKTVFYKLHFAEREAQQRAYIENGGDPEKYQVLPDEDEEVFKAEMTIIKEKRQKAFLALEEEKQKNLKKKEAIIEKIKAMVTTPDEANKNFPVLKTLQQEWKEIKMVPAEKANELWRNYQLYVEQFYDLLNLNREAREYDFKKNRCGHALKQLALLSTSVTNSTLKLSAIAKRRTLQRRLLYARRSKRSSNKRIKRHPIGRNIQRRLSLFNRNGRR